MPAVLECGHALLDQEAAEDGHRRRSVADDIFEVLPVDEARRVAEASDGLASSF